MDITPTMYHNLVKVLRSNPPNPVRVVFGFPLTEFTYGKIDKAFTLASVALIRCRIEAGFEETSYVQYPDGRNIELS